MPAFYDRSENNLDLYRWCIALIRRQQGITTLIRFEGLNSRRFLLYHYLRFWMRIGGSSITGHPHPSCRTDRGQEERGGYRPYERRQTAGFPSGRGRPSDRCRYFRLRLLVFRVRAGLCGLGGRRTTLCNFGAHGSRMTALNVLRLCTKQGMSTVGLYSYLFSDDALFCSARTAVRSCTGWGTLNQRIRLAIELRS